MDRDYLCVLRVGFPEGPASLSNEAFQSHAAAAPFFDTNLMATGRCMLRGHVKVLPK